MTDWLRVNKQSKCPICDKADWCMVCPEAKLILCMRVESKRPSKGKAGGWLHDFGDPKYTPPKHEKPVIPIDCASLMALWRSRTAQERLESIGCCLGVDMEALDRLGASWSEEHQAWAFPMRVDGKIVGIRLRTEKGQKFCVKGSKQGLFIPDGEIGKILTVTEGPTDCAAALTMGFSAIGRPSCLGCEDEIIRFIQRHAVQRVIIVSDNDTHSNNYAGQRGAQKLQASLPVPSIIFTPPCKDLREFLTRGGSRQLLVTLTKDLVWSQPKT